MTHDKLRIAITHGNTNGVGYELIFKTFADNAMFDLCTPIIYGSPKAATYHRKAIESECNFHLIEHINEAQDGRINLITTFDEEVKIDLGENTKEAEAAAQVAFEKAISDLKNNEFDILVNTPALFGGEVGDKTNFNNLASALEEAANNKQKTLPIVVGEELIAASVTVCETIKNIASQLSIEKIVEAGEILHHTLKQDLRFDNPRIAVLTLNSSGTTSNDDENEETLFIEPAIKILNEKGIICYGTYTTNEFWKDDLYKSFDAVLCMYEEQYTTAMNLLSKEKNEVLLFGNLPFVCTNPFCGLQLNIAGKGIANEIMFRNTIYKAIDMHRNRIIYNAPFKNPLPKLYKDRRDDSYKIAELKDDMQ